jgi:hypothetical protein
MFRQVFTVHVEQVVYEFNERTEYAYARRSFDAQDLHNILFLNET